MRKAASPEAASAINDLQKQVGNAPLFNDTASENTAIQQFNTDRVEKDMGDQSSIWFDYRTGIQTFKADNDPGIYVSAPGYTLPGEWARQNFKGTPHEANVKFPVGANGRIGQQRIPHDANLQRLTGQIVGDTQKSDPGKYYKTTPGMANLYGERRNSWTHPFYDPVKGMGMYRF